MEVIDYTVYTARLKPWKITSVGHPSCTLKILQVRLCSVDFELKL